MKAILYPYPHLQKLLALTAAILLFAGVLAPTAAEAQNWPNHPLKWVVPFSPGGANDLVARAAAEAVSKRLGQPIIIENKPGGGTIVATDYVSKSKPDGYTFLIGAAGVITNSLLNEKLPYSDSDIVPVGMIAVSPSVIVVHPSSPLNTVKDLVDYAKKQGKDGVDFATAGSGSTPHFVIEMLKEATGANFTTIPFKSGQESVTAVLGNQVTATSESSVVVLPHIKAGKLKALGATWETRISAYPSIQTTAEQGYPGVRIGHWAGLFAPKGTPSAVIERMNTELQTALKSKELHDRFVPSGIEPAPGSVAQFVAFINNERERLGKIAKKAGMKAEH
jgi:tripartite-type tricarboxylate transporter receptor subunit TctC